MRKIRKTKKKKAKKYQGPDYKNLDLQKEA